jgi:hypothetical protein
VAGKKRERAAFGFKVAVRREANGYSFGKYLSAAETTVRSNETIITIFFDRQNTQAKTVGPPKKRCLLQLATAAYQALLVDINRSRKDQIKIILKDKRSVVKIAKKNGMVVAREAQLGISFGQKEKFVSSGDIKPLTDDLENTSDYGDNRSQDGADDDDKKPRAKTMGKNLKAKDNNGVQGRDKEQSEVEEDKICESDDVKMEVQGSIGNNTSVEALIAASLARMEERHKKELEAQRKYYDERLNNVQMEARNQELMNKEVRRKERVENDKAQRLLMQEAQKCEKAVCELNQEQRDKEFQKARQDVLKRQTQKEVSGLFLCCLEYMMKSLVANNVQKQSAMNEEKGKSKQGTLNMVKDKIKNVVNNLSKKYIDILSFHKLTGKEWGREDEGRQ